MTVQELFAKVNREELVNRLDDYCGEEFAEIMLEEFEEMAAYGEDKVLTSYDYITNTRFHTGGPLSLADWGAALGAEIDESLFESMTELELAEKIFEQMTENGSDFMEHHAEITRLLDGGSLAI